MTEAVQNIPEMGFCDIFGTPRVRFGGIFHFFSTAVNARSGSRRLA
jgi:hypothetical protein